MTVVWRLNFLGVARRNRRNRARSQNRRLHQVDVAVHLHKARAEMCIVNAKDIFEHVSAITTLECDIVDGKDRLDVGIVRTAGKHQVIINRDKCGLPIVAVDDIGFPIQVGQDLEHCLTKVCESFCIIILAIQLGACKIIFVVDKVIGHAALFTVENAAILIAPAQLDVSIFQMGHLLTPVLADGTVKRAEYAHVMTCGGKRLRQCTGYISQSARLDKRRNLRADKHNFHNGIPSPESRKRELPTSDAPAHINGI